MSAPGLALAQGLLLEFGPLFALQDYEPIGTRLEALKAALLGQDGLSERTLVELRLAAQQWSRLSPTVQAFYTTPAALRNESARVLLWYTLSGQGQPAPWQIRRVNDLWADLHGIPPIAHKLWLPLDRQEPTKETTP